MVALGVSYLIANVTLCSCPLQPLLRTCLVSTVLGVEAGDESSMLLSTQDVSSTSVISAYAMEVWGSLGNISHTGQEARQAITELLTGPHEGVQTAQH